MAAPFEVRNPDGTLQFDIDNRLYRRLTFVATGTADGSITVPAAGQGQLVAVQVNNPPEGVTPTVNNSGTTVSWSFGGAPPSDRRAVTIAIGVY